MLAPFEVNNGNSQREYQKIACGFHSLRIFKVAELLPQNLRYLKQFTQSCICIILLQTIRGAPSDARVVRGHATVIPVSNQRYSSVYINGLNPCTFLCPIIYIFLVVNDNSVLLFFGIGWKSRKGFIRAGPGWFGLAVRLGSRFRVEATVG